MITGTLIGICFICFLLSYVCYKLAAGWRTAEGLCIEMRNNWDNAERRVDRLEEFIKEIQNTNRELIDSSAELEKSLKTESRKLNAIRELNKALTAQKPLKRQELLILGLTEIARFIASNQWILEKSKDFRQALTNLQEIAEVQDDYL